MESKLKKMIREEIEKLDIDEGFWDGTQKFEEKRNDNAQKAGYKLTGKSDVKVNMKFEI